MWLILTCVPLDNTRGPTTYNANTVLSSYFVIASLFLNHLPNVHAYVFSQSIQNHLLSALL